MFFDNQNSSYKNTSILIVAGYNEMTVEKITDANQPIFTVFIGNLAEQFVVTAGNNFASEDKALRENLGRLNNEGVISLRDVDAIINHLNRFIKAHGLQSKFATRTADLSDGFHPGRSAAY